MLYTTVEQLYSDVEKLAQNPGRLAEPAMLELFNANLAEAKKQYSSNAILAAIQEASGEVKFGDLLVRIGQLKAVLIDE